MVTVVVGVLQTTPLEQAQGYSGGWGIADSIRASTGLLWWWGYCRLLH